MVDIKTIFATIDKVRYKSDYARGTPVGAALVIGEAVVYGWNCYATGLDSGLLNKSLARKKCSPYVVHAEISCLLKAARQGLPTEGGEMFITRHPCISCTSAMIEAGIKKIHFLNEKKIDENEIEERFYRFIPCGIEFYEYSVTEGGMFYSRSILP